MDLDWLYGAPAVAGERGVVVDASHVLDLGDVQDLIDAAEAMGADVELRRVRGDRNINSVTDHVVDVASASDADLERIAFVDASGKGFIQMKVRLGSGLAPEITASVLGLRGEEVTPETTRFLLRAAEILNGSRRRIPRWRVAAAALVASRVSLALVWVGVVAVTLPSLWPAVVAGLAVFAASPGISARIAGLHPRWWAVGAIAIDASPRREVRLRRANNHRDLKVAALTVAGTLLTGALIALVRWVMTR